MKAMTALLFFRLFILKCFTTITHFLKCCARLVLLKIILWIYLPMPAQNRTFGIQTFLQWMSVHLGRTLNIIILLLGMEPTKQTNILCEAFIHWTWFRNSLYLVCCNYYSLGWLEYSIPHKEQSYSITMCRWFIFVIKEMIELYYLLLYSVDSSHPKMEPRASHYLGSYQQKLTKIQTLTTYRWPYVIVLLEDGWLGACWNNNSRPAILPCEA